MCNKNDIANAVMKYCDEDHGIVFNKHRSRNENKFSTIYDYSISSISTNSNVSNCSHDLKSVTGKSIKSFDSVSQPKCYYRSSLENLHRNKEQKNDKTYTNKTKIDVEIKNNKTSEMSDDTHEIIAPEGKGKFIKFIGENYVYVLLENGTYNCYPIELLKLNRSYLKKNTMYNLSYNYKDMTLSHTRNILKSKNNPSYENENTLNEENRKSDEFLCFPEEMDYLKHYIIKNDIEDANVSEKDYAVHMFVKNRQSNDTEHDKNYLHDPIVPIKKNFTVKTLNNEYKIENTSSYIPIDYMNFDNENCNICC
ncbi:conserved Plasmodium protein, unknown function [Plasmodium relictum]|uniref:Uncharacterized protein n=1 Tax=Plasmodium relictum TaxID=85471 RepID=A0A1J1HD03_PLARL|nr:conserved Plasmodium protein, unknown function [Plasmodium relictum]CRH03803.1 conserved Plasmodium protein, unknown function [Plasmodium relictum]